MGYPQIFPSLTILISIETNGDLGIHFKKPSYTNGDNMTSILHSIYYVYFSFLTYSSEDAGNVTLGKCMGILLTFI
jgi:hypothetical protein